MSTLYVDTQKVDSVLLADGWHPVAEGSLVVGTVQFLEGSEHRLPGREGFEFKQADGVVVSGPLTSILAVARRTAGA